MIRSPTPNRFVLCLCSKRNDALILSLAVFVAFAPPMRGHAGAGAADPSGHWEGAIHAPSQDVTVAVDLALGRDGKLVGTVSNPSEHITGYPLATATIDGANVRLEMKTGGSGVQTMSGKLAADSKTLSGDFLVGVYSVPFDLERAGDARFAPEPKNGAIEAGFVGEWASTLDLGGNSLPVVLKLANRSDGTSAGSWSAGDGSATSVVISQRASSVTITSNVTPAAYVGTLSADDSEIAGTFTEGSLKQPMTFRRAAAHR
jgi:hypothetical protein